MDLKKLLHLALNTSICAGEEIMDVYNTKFSVDFKEDESPLTLADKKSHNKIVPFNNFKDKYGLLAENILVMGDDIPDIPIIKSAGIGCCPQDAVQEVKNSSDYISQKSGGMGAVRDIIEQVMKIHKKWI